MYCSSDLILITACRHVVAKGQLKSMSEDACVDTFGGGNNGDQVTFQLNNMMVRHHLHNISICRLGRTRATGRGHTWRPSASFCPGATRFACACVENIPEPCVTRVRSANDYDMCVDRANSRNVHIWGCHSGEASHHITSHHITSRHIKHPQAGATSSGSTTRPRPRSRTTLARTASKSSVNRSKGVSRVVCCDVAHTITAARAPSRWSQARAATVQLRSGRSSTSPLARATWHVMTTVTHTVM